MLIWQLAERLSIFFLYFIIYILFQLMVVLFVLSNKNVFMILF